MLIKKLQGPAEIRNGYYYEFDLHSKPLGEGGMGVVYKGFKIYETTGNRQVVAIKAMFEGLPEEVYNRAEREASIRLRNDNLVEMLDFYTEREADPYGQFRQKYYVISEYLNGVVLSDMLTGQFKDKDGIEIPFAKQLYADYISDRETTSVEILKKVLSGIMALHDKGYIHRDIDPTNIMVTDEGSIKLIDFGIAKYIRSLGTIDKSLTSTGKFIGKAEYASPELVLGDVRSQGYQTDIYAIGILFFQLLYGKLPFEGSKYEVLQQQLKDKVPVGKIRNKGFRKIIKKATEKNIQDRYSSVAEMRVDLDCAANASDSFISLYSKRILIALASTAACFVVLWILFRGNPTPQPSPQDTLADQSSAQTEVTVQSQSQSTTDASTKQLVFKEALAKLDSKDRAKAQIGLQEMKKLAEENYAHAQIELGKTYCPYDRVLSSLLNTRRRTLQLNATTSAKLSMDYLQHIVHDSVASAEDLYILGYSYWKHHDWDKGIEALTRALECLSASQKGTSMESNIRKYLDLCKKRGN